MHKRSIAFRSPEPKGRVPVRRPDRLCRLHTARGQVAKGRAHGVVGRLVKCCRLRMDRRLVHPKRQGRHEVLPQPPEATGGGTAARRKQDFPRNASLPEFLTQRLPRQQAALVREYCRDASQGRCGRLRLRLTGGPSCSPDHQADTSLPGLAGQALRPLAPRRDRLSQLLCGP